MLPPRRRVKLQGIAVVAMGYPTPRASSPLGPPLSPGAWASPCLRTCDVDTPCKPTAPLRCSSRPTPSPTRPNMPHTARGWNPIRLTLRLHKYWHWYDVCQSFVGMSSRHVRRAKTAVTEPIASLSLRGEAACLAKSETISYPTLKHWCPQTTFASLCNYCACQVTKTQL